MEKCKHEEQCEQWSTGDPICTMTDSHVANCINYLKEKMGWNINSVEDSADAQYMIEYMEAALAARKGTKKKVIKGFQIEG